MTIPTYWREIAGQGALAGEPRRLQAFAGNLSEFEGLLRRWQTHAVRKRRIRAAWAVLSVLALAVLTGCVKVDGDLELASDNTVSGSVLVAISSSWAISNGEDPTNLADAISEELASAPDAGVTGEPYDDGEFVGMTLTLDQVQIDRISDATSGALRITRRTGEYVVEGNFSELDPTVAGEEPTDVPWQVHLSITFPAEVSEHDGALDGRTVTWDLGPGETTLLARAGTGEPITLTDRVPVAVMALVVLVGVAALLTWRLGKRQKERDKEAGRPMGIRARQAAAKSGTSGGVADIIAKRKAPRG